MQRRVDVVLPSRHTARLVRELRQLEGVLDLRVEHGISQHPSGDLITVEALSRSSATASAATRRAR